MNRRGFLRAAIGGAVAARTWPFRVYSFPSEVVIPPTFVTDGQYMFLSKSVSIWDLEDSAFDLELFLKVHFAEKLAAIRRMGIV